LSFLENTPQKVMLLVQRRESMNFQATKETRETS
jgi:hypothetical protein